MVFLHIILKSARVSCRPTTINIVFKSVLSSRFYGTMMQPLVRPKFKRQRPVFDYAGLVLLIIPVTAFGLGTWQIFRKFEKEEQIKEFLEKIDQPPVELPENLEELKDMEFRAVKVRGTFDHSKELFLGPRTQVLEESFKKGIGLFSRSKGGFMVITPFKLSDRDLTILVNRGWVPAHLKSPLARLEGQISGEVELVGLVRLQESRKPLGVKNMPEKGFWVYRDVLKMAEMVGAEPVFLDADVKSTVPGGPIGGQTITQQRNPHVSYILTWYGLALLSSWMLYKRFTLRTSQNPRFPY